MDILVAKTDVGTVEYSDRGSGQVVLFFHGGHGNCRESLFQNAFPSHGLRSKLLHDLAMDLHH